MCNYCGSTAETKMVKSYLTGDKDKSGIDRFTQAIEIELCGVCQKVLQEGGALQVNDIMEMQGKRTNKILQFLNIKMLLIAIFIFTLVDVIFTVYGIKAKLIEEANPIFAYLMMNHTTITGIAILVIITCALYFFYKIKHKIKWLQYALIGLFMAKAVIFVYEMALIKYL